LEVDPADVDDADLHAFVRLTAEALTHLVDRAQPTTGIRPSPAAAHRPTSPITTKAPLDDLSVAANRGVSAGRAERGLFAEGARL
jgi:hypothetical protein